MLKKSYFRVVILLLGIILASVLIGCDLFNDETILEGTWIGGSEGEEDHWMWIFNELNWTLKEKDGSIYVNSQKGTFFLNTSNTRYTGRATHEWRNGSWVAFNGAEAICDIVISGKTLIMTSHGNSPGWPTSWTETYKKQ